MIKYISNQKFKDMKRLFFLLLLLFATQISAQTDFFVIGDSNTSQRITTAPLVCDNKYSYTQSLYKSNELMVGEITIIVSCVLPLAYLTKLKPKDIMI